LKGLIRNPCIRLARGCPHSKRVEEA